MEKTIYKIAILSFGFLFSYFFYESYFIEKKAEEKRISKVQNSKVEINKIEDNVAEIMKDKIIELSSKEEKKSVGEDERVNESKDERTEDDSFEKTQSSVNNKKIDDLKNQKLNINKKGNLDSLNIDESVTSLTSGVDSLDQDLNKDSEENIDNEDFSDNEDAVNDYADEDENSEPNDPVICEAERDFCVPREIFDEVEDDIYRCLTELQYCVRSFGIKKLSNKEASDIYDEKLIRFYKNKASGD